jgi:hypothetical protein
MFEIWRHRSTGERFLVVVREGRVNVAAGPLGADEDPRQVLETHSNQNHNPLALLDMQYTPEAYAREYTTTGPYGRAVPVLPLD